MWSLFVVWPHNEEVEFVWQKALTEIANHLDDTPNTGPVAIGGWSPNTMDPPTIELTLRRTDLDIRYFGSDSETEPINTLIFPHAEAGEEIRILLPTVRPLASALQTKLSQFGATPQSQSSFTFYTVSSIQYSVFSSQSPASFNNEIQLLNTEILPDGLLITWQVLAPANGPRRFFIHALDINGDILAQHDGLDAPAAYWQPGDIILQFHPLSITNAISTYRLGLYNPDTCPACQNLRTDDGAEFVLIRP
jgi:hypothetical protein